MSKGVNGRTLLNLFTPPEETLRGVFGLMCGLSADQQFLEIALEKFSGLGMKQRLYSSPWSLTLFLDARKEHINSVSGIYNFWPKENWPTRTKLMHAKVALLGFGESTRGQSNYFRLIVSTGNWTKEAINDNINLTWFCDYDSRRTKGQEQQAADFLEAVAFWNCLLGSDPHSSHYYQVVGDRYTKINSFLKFVTEKIERPPKRVTSRFLTNLSGDKGQAISDYFKAGSLGAKVIRKFSNSSKRHNFIVCGSGFFEQKQGGSDNNEPEVLTKLIGSLKESALTKEPTKWLVFNPNTSGAVGHWLKKCQIKSVDWILPKPKHPESTIIPFPFHAKYIFISNKNYTDYFTNGMLYIGSGNLSKRGFALGPESYGNIEAGVVIEIPENGYVNEFCELLGINPENTFKLKDIPDQPDNEDMEDDVVETQIPPPIEGCIWHGAISKLTWIWTDTSWENTTLDDIHLLSPEQIELYLPGKNHDFNEGILLRANRNHRSYEWILPVLDEFSLFSSSPPRIRPVKEIIDMLNCFPSFRDEEEPDELDEFPEDHKISEIPLPATSISSELRSELERYPLHRATVIIETIASRNQIITPGQMADWTDLLKRTLIKSLEPARKAELNSFSADILSVLINEKGFAPESPSDDYKNTIREIITDWNNQSDV